MPLSLTVSSPYINLGSKIRFEAIGGSEPYSYEVSEGGGSIDADGIYTASGSKIERIKIKVTDNIGSIKFSTVSVATYLHLIAHIIRTELSLDSDQVYIYNQKINIPTDDKLYVAVILENTKVISSSSKFNDGVEYRAVASFNTVKIDILSKTTEALIRKDEVISSLRGIFSQRVQNSNTFKIADIPSSAANISQVDGSAIPYRFNISINVTAVSKSEKSVDYYNGNIISFDTKTGDNTIVSET